MSLTNGLYGAMAFILTAQTRPVWRAFSNRITDLKRSSPGTIVKTVTHAKKMRTL